MNLGIDLNEEFEFERPCGALTAVYVIGILTMSSILIVVVALFRGLRKAGSNG